jgi:hypothetical protein
MVAKSGKLMDPDSLETFTLAFLQLLPSTLFNVPSGLS